VRRPGQPRSRVTQHTNTCSLSAEAGALELFGRGLPPVASADVTFRYWRPPVAGRQAILVGFGQGKASGFCSGYTLLGRIEMPTANQERGLPIARCTLGSSLTAEWSSILRATDL
jgi:hypothetical protein